MNFTIAQISQTTGYNKKTKGSQVVVLVGEGANRRSVTRHINAAGMGNTPYPGVIEAHKTVANNIVAVEGALGMLRSSLTKLEAAEGTNHVDVVNKRISIKVAEDTLAAQKREQARLEKEMPLQVEFLDSVTFHNRNRKVA